MDTPKATFYVIKVGDSYQRFDMRQFLTTAIANSLFHNSLAEAEMDLTTFFKSSLASIVKIDLFENIEKSHLDARIKILEAEVKRLKALKGR